MAKPGDNSRERSILDRLIRIEQQRKELKADFDDILLEGKSAGLTPKALRQRVREEMLTEQQIARREQDKEDYQVLLERLGEYADTELGEAALQRRRA